MRKCFKRLMAGFIALVMLVSAQGFVVFGEELQNPVYLPLRMVFESHGAEVLWSDEERNIVVNMEDGGTIVFTPGEGIAMLNGETMPLSFPIVHVDDRTFISVFDTLFLYGHESGDFMSTIITAVASAYEIIELVGVTGIGIAIVDVEQGFTWTGGFGFADTQERIYVSGDTVFALASISKTFTAVAVMQLVEEGIIDLDMPVVYYLPDFFQAPSPLLGGDSNNITVRMLLTHTSGILPNFSGAGGWTAYAQNPDYMQNFLENLAGFYMQSPEDMLFAYNNNGFNLLGVLVASLTSDDYIFYGFANYMAENVFAPAGMNNSGFVANAPYIAPYLASAYVNSATPTYMIFSNGLPTGGVFASVNDMAAFMHVFFGSNDILGAEYTAQMMEAHDFDFTLSMGGMRYSFGMMHNTSMDGFQTIGHGGNLIHFHSEMVFDPNSGLGVFVTTNSATGIFAASPLATNLLALAVLEKTGTIETLPVAADPEAVPIELSAEELAALQGVFLGAQEYYVVVFDEESGMLVILLPTVPELPPLTLTPLSDGSFDVPILGRLWFEVFEEEGESVILLRMGNFNFHLIGIGLDKEVFIADESFLPWIGTFMPVNEGYNRQNVAVVSYGIDEFGFGVVYAQTLNLISIASPQQIGNGMWLFAMEDVEHDEAGRVIAYMSLGQRFERVE
ncbi:MAG: serine hydrolase [Defluviitaleaceae bacterium]|nr:serine hydrolase [Defluviitaleaceae bacterium]